MASHGMCNLDISHWGAARALVCQPTSRDAVASARLDGHDPSTLRDAIGAYVRGERTIDALVADALLAADKQPAR
jgi:hypothetical protein